MKTRTTKTEYARALDLLTRYLALRDHSRKELETKLAAKFASDLVRQVLEGAAASGLLTPEEQIAERAERVFRARLKSRRYIEEQLAKRDLPVPPPDSEVELETARRLAEKKFGELSALSYDDKSKAYRYMKYRGFEDRTIRMVLNGQEF